MIIKNDKLLKQSKFEKGIQTFVENHIPDILGEEYEFVCREFSIGDFIVDSLVFNRETQSFIIIVDKKVESRNIMNDGLNYLKLLKDKETDFIIKYNGVKGTNYKKYDIDYSQSKVVFFSPYYNEYQLYSSNYQNVPFELYQVTKYEDDIINIEKIERNSKLKFNNAIFNDLSKPIYNDLTKSYDDGIKVFTEEDHTSYSNQNIIDLYEKLKYRILELGDIDLIIKKIYITFKGRRNIVDIVFYKEKLELFINLKKGKLSDPMNITRDISNKGDLGNGDYSIDICKIDDIDKVMPLIKQSLEVNKK